MKKVIRGILLIFFTGTLTFSLWKLWGIREDYREGTEGYQALEQYVSVEEPAAVPTDPARPTEAPDSTAGTEAPDVSAWPQVDFDSLSQINPDIVAWIYIEGTDIHYPVVRGRDNDYYLDHLFDGTGNAAGCIFMDYRCAADLSDRHTIVYGHHMKDRSMFAGLVDYKNQAFYDAHPVALLVTPEAYYELRFFSGYVSDTWSDAWELEFSEHEYLSWLEELRRRSCFETDCAPTTGDRVVTLSTCSYEFETAKFVLHGYISKEIEKTAHKETAE